MSSLISYFKRFLHKHSYLVDFTSASIIICLCFIILLPKVHESFQTVPHLPLDQEDISPVVASSTPGFTTIATIEGPIQQLQQPAEINNDHHHNHQLPIGEIIICIGFFVFYCIGLGLSKSESKETEPLLLNERKISTVCCSSTRCPSGQREVLESCEIENRHNNSHEEMLEGAHIINEANQEEDCVLLLNRHHNHHTHTRHHEHQQTTTKVRKDYGSNSRYNETPDLVKNSYSNVKPARTVYVEEIRVTRIDDPYCDKDYVNWPLSARVTLFGLFLASALIIFDMNIHGLMETIKVFRAAATGALLYVAFFLVLPKNLAGCNSCTKEKA